MKSVKGIVDEAAEIFRVIFHSLVSARIRQTLVQEGGRQAVYIVDVLYELGQIQGADDFPPDLQQSLHIEFRPL